MLSLTTMMTMATLKTMKLTKNPILVTGIGRGWAEAFPALGHSVIIAGHRQDVLDQTTDANPGRRLCSAGKEFGRRIRQRSEKSLMLKQPLVPHKTHSQLSQ